MNKNSTSIIAPLDSNELSITKTILWLELIRDKFTKEDLMNANIGSKFAIVDSDSLIHKSSLRIEHRIVCRISNDDNDLHT